MVNEPARVGGAGEVLPRVVKGAASVEVKYRFASNPTRERSGGLVPRRRERSDRPWGFESHPLRHDAVTALGGPSRHHGIAWTNPHGEGGAGEVLPQAVKGRARGGGTSRLGSS